jgi:hypothetical protein
MKTRGGRTRLTLLKELLEGALDDDPASQIVAVGLSRDDARFFAKALKAYLEKGSTLHQAFDLTVKRGAPKSGGKHRELAREAWELKLVGKTWEQVADALGKRTTLDAIQLRKLCVNYWPMIRGEIVTEVVTELGTKK